MSRCDKFTSLDSPTETALSVIFEKRTRDSFTLLQNQVRRLKYFQNDNQKFHLEQSLHQNHRMEGL